jgi:precorrin-2 dehydrogenase/sirohydrochlorin ferrochelatase
LETFPAYFPLKGARIVIAGDGEAAEAKARLFDGSPALIVRLTRAEAVTPQAYEGATLIFVASGDEQTLQRAATAARGAKAPLNVVDHPDISDFHTPAIIDRGQVVAAVGTAGASPVLASLLRAEIELHLPPGTGEIARLLGERRADILGAFPDFAARRAFFRQVLAGPASRAAGEGDLTLAARFLDQAIGDPAARQGLVSLVAAPRHADLLSIRAVRALNRADVVVVGAGADLLVATHARRDAERWTGAPLDRLCARAKGGDLIAVVEADLDPGLANRLAASGVAEEHPAPAPCP